MINFRLKAMLGVMVVALLLPFCVYSQKYAVSRFDIVPTDLTARMNSRVDNNGRKCALLKVYVSDRISVARGPVVGELLSAGMEKQVYVSHDSKQIELVFENHYPLHIIFNDYGYPAVSEQMVYVVELAETSPATAPPVAQQPEQQNAPTPAAPVPSVEPIPKTMELITTIDPHPSHANNGNSVVASGSNVETFKVNGVSFEMVRVEGGSFQMGSNKWNNAQPVHSETVSTFYIGKTEVTQSLWEAVMGSNPSKFPGETYPVENISWNDCQEFVDRLSRLTGRNFRLPTEAEWEYAARGGNRSRGYTYSGSNDIDRVAWYYENSGVRTHPVAQKLDNELGIFDMSGNVLEWTSDACSSNYSSPRDSARRVMRGGDCIDEASECRVADRSCYSPGDRYSFNGFRLAL